MPIPHTPTRRLAAVLALTLVVASCGAAATPGVDGDVSAPSTDAPTASVASDDESPAASATPIADQAKQRCVDAVLILNQRIDAEGFEYPEEVEELSEEEREKILIPAIEVADDVADPASRPAIEAMAAFDANTSPIPEVDALVGACFESGIVTDADIYGEDDGGGEGDEGDDEEFCREIAALSAEEVAEFAAEEGEAVVREEFAFCGLEAPLDS